MLDGTVPRDAGAQGVGTTIEAPVGLVLAAGTGRRYGRPKILVPGWLDAAVAALRLGGCDVVRVVTGPARPRLPEGAVELHCPQWRAGIGASLRAGLEAAGTPARTVVHLIDCPDVGADVVLRVLALGGDNLARAVYAGRPGHPVVIPGRHIPALLASLGDAVGTACTACTVGTVDPEGRGGARHFLAARTDVVGVDRGDLATGLDHDEPSPELEAARCATS